MPQLTRRTAAGVIAAIAASGLCVAVVITHGAPLARASTMSAAQYASVALSEVQGTWGISASPASTSSAPASMTVNGTTHTLITDPAAQSGAISQSPGAEVLASEFVATSHMAGGTKNGFFWIVDLAPAEPVYPASDGGVTSSPSRPAPDNYYLVFVDAYTGIPYMTATGEDSSLPTFSQLRTDVKVGAQ